MNPFMAFCLYVAARVFVQYLKKMPDDYEVRQSLEFLLAAMRAIQRKNPLSESFLAQLNMDIEGSGLDFSSHNLDSSSQYVSGRVSSFGHFAITPDITLQPHKILLTPLQDSSHTLPNESGNRKLCTSIFHISETSEEGQSPDENRSPYDTRIPDKNNWKGSPTIRTEDPGQKTYAYRSPSVISRMHSAPRPFFPETDQSRAYLPQADTQNKPNAGPQRYEKIFPPDDWNQGNIATVGGLDSFTDNNASNGINTNSRHLDTEMAEQSPNSRGPTPQSNSSYNPSSSNTSYSPSQAHDDDQTASGTGGGNAPFAQRQEDPFKIPASWEAGTGLTPGSGMTPGSLTGMTPDGGWEKLMDSIGWETGRMG